MSEYQNEELEDKKTRRQSLLHLGELNLIQGRHQGEVGNEIGEKGQHKQGQILVAKGVKEDP
jgi:hypothetical protein